VATALSARELLAYLRGAGLPLEHIDVVVASGGSAVYYSVPVAALDPEGRLGYTQGSQHQRRGRAPLEDGKGWQLVPDPDYFLHIEYRWSADAVRRSLPARALLGRHCLRLLLLELGLWDFAGCGCRCRHCCRGGRRAFQGQGQGRGRGWGRGGGEHSGGGEPPLGLLKGVSGGVLQALVEDELHSTPRCLAYRVLHADKVLYASARCTYCTLLQADKVLNASAR